MASHLDTGTGKSLWGTRTGGDKGYSNGNILKPGERKKKAG